MLPRVIRGCWTLPYVGAHPGTPALIAFTAMGAAAGARDGWHGALVGVGLMLTVFGPMYLWGAYDRAKISDGKA